ncbi:MAG: IS110 family transposase [Desulfobacterales bacterium]|nr:IS110 family transposase [Desulfobacterales bacterium]
MKVDSLKQINLDAAGLDIGASEIYACIPEGRDEKNVKLFKTFTADLIDLANWFTRCKITTVAMESTGVYWIPVYEILENRGFEVNLINARQIKNVPGKKTDILDCQWIQQLHSYGLLRSSFRPEEDMCSLRAYIRHREMLVKYRAIHIQHIQKHIEIMNIKLCSVLKDITGVTGMKIIRAILEGERDSVKLAQFRDPRCFSSEEEIAKSLEGNYKPEHIFGLRQSVELYDYYSTQIATCDREIAEKYSAIKIDGPNELPPLPKKRVKSLKNKPAFDLRTHLYHICGVDLTMIDGLDSLTVQTVISEIGLDMSRWRTVKHFTSWLGVCPCNKITGGKVIRRGSKKVDNRATLALRIAARSLHGSKSAMGAFYRRMRAKHGPMKANLAAAHKLARIIYFMMKNKVEYKDAGEEYYQEKYRDRIVKN